MQIFQGKWNQYILGFVQQPNAVDNSNYIQNWRVIWKGPVYFLFQETSPKKFLDANTENGNTFSSNHYGCLLIAVFMYWLSFRCNIYISIVHLLIFIFLFIRVLLYFSLQLEFISLHCGELFTTLGKLVQDLTGL